MKTLLRLMLLAVPLIVGPLTTHAYAVGCYNNLPANTTVVLTADLACLGLSGMAVLNVTSSNVIIELNGHTISCLGPLCGVGQSTIGIQAVNKAGSMANVKIMGPGTISGFDTGILFEAPTWADGSGLSISQVNVTGPGSTGILLTNPGATICATQRDGSLGPAAFTVSDNQVSGLVRGIEINGGMCGQITRNLIADNSGGAGGGLRMLFSGSNTISRNFLAHNGYAYNNQHVMLIYGGSDQIFLNYLTSNSSGIVIEGGLERVWANTVRFTSPGGTDMTDLTVEPGANYWYANNICQTQLGLPPGICNPGE